jgi:hypothetical protein
MSGSDARFEHRSELSLPFVPDVAFSGNAETGPAYWFVDNLWVVLVDGRQTAGAYSLMEQLMPKVSRSARCPHPPGTVAHRHPMSAARTNTGAHIAETRPSMSCVTCPSASRRSWPEW